MNTLKTVTPERELDGLYRDVKELIEQSKAHVVSHVNQTLVLTYWQIGKMIRTELLGNDRADYGDATVKRLAQRLQIDYGSGFSYSSLTRMRKFFEFMSDQSIVATLSQQLSWSHFVELLKVEDQIKREFYATMCSDARWSVRTLRERMDSMLYERTAIAKEPEAILRKELAELQQFGTTSKPALFLKDPYLLDFLDLKDGYTEQDIEGAILAELERFILELGSDFAFMSRQKRIQVGGNDYYIDLLFYHRKLRRLVVIELKLGEFKPEHKGQVELYLKWLAKYEQQDNEEAPIAIILCSDKDHELVELMDLAQDHIHVSEYWLELPSKEILKSKLHKALAQARARIACQQNELSS